MTGWDPPHVQRQIGWREATEAALYGAEGFFRRGAGVPGRHFRTSVHASPLFAQAVLTLARSVQLTTVIDVGAGGGELLTALQGLDPDLTLVGVDLAPRPEGLGTSIAWQQDVPPSTDALLIANERLDNAPVDVAVQTVDGWRLILVDPATGEEQVGGPVADADLDWLTRWWPGAAPKDRAEIGRPRDEVWSAAVGSISRGVAVAVDYFHLRGARPAQGSLTGYRDGRQVTPVPDGSCDITSHVALDACAVAAAQDPHLCMITGEVLTTQRLALGALGIRAERPSHELSRTDPVAYLRALSAVGEVAELTDPAGLGGFGWLVQTIGVEMPEPLRAVPSLDRQQP